MLKYSNIINMSQIKLELSKNQDIMSLQWLRSAVIMAKARISLLGLNKIKKSKVGASLLLHFVLRS